MKHLLNNLSNEEKNRIREQYEGGMSVDNSRFKKLMESKLGNVKPLIMEQESGMVINLPKDIKMSSLDTGGIYEKDDVSLTLYDGDEPNRGSVIFKFDLDDIPEIKDITNTIKNPYGEYKKTWERISDTQVKVHS